MKPSSSWEMFRYWTELRGRRIAPERESDLIALRKILGDSIVLVIRSQRRMSDPFGRNSRSIGGPLHRALTSSIISSAGPVMGRTSNDDSPA